ncbi:hypothetical protein PV328_002186 [Microctonus aethiopoides]|uniref:Ig-like domain-containing protein n=1 Tax=Microctonus aethiopoides TaxID=144406 RepID=A0AA39FYJ5_9HYME|nr:hypothetical protein PV328_002186 [Microctonus aethiopoides]
MEPFVTVRLEVCLVVKRKRIAVRNLSANNLTENSQCASKNGNGGAVVEHHPSSYWEQPFSQPYFDNTTKRETTTTVGQSAYLYCRVRNLGDRAVSFSMVVPEIFVVVYLLYIV